MLPKDEIASLGNINLLAGFLDISVKASTCFKAITVSLVPDSNIALLTFSMHLLAWAIISIALALPSASVIEIL